MTEPLKIILWNSNGVLKRKNELELILETENIDVCLLTETHLDKNSKFTFRKYNHYVTPHPNNSSRGGSAILIKKTIKHYEDNPIATTEFQITTVTVETNGTPLQLSALYSPPRSQIKANSYENLIKTYKYKFIIGGDFNAKHTFWGSRLITTKGRELYKALKQTGCNAVSTGKPTYWPTDRNKLPDLIDFFVLI